MGKIREWLRKMSIFFSSLFKLTSYSEAQKQIDEQLKNISESLKHLQESVNSMTDKLQSSSEKIDNLEGELTKVKNGLQLELFQSLQELHATLTSRGWASPQEKLEAKQYYDGIHILGKDGWTEKYYTDIINLPE